MTNSTFLDGKLLIAMPGIGDPRFHRSVIYMCAHSAEGAMGIVINKQAEDMTFLDLLHKLDIISGDEPIRLDEEIGTRPVQFGGPVETGRGFVLHSSDYFIRDSSLRIDERFVLSATLDILRAIAIGEGPSQALLALGYAGWGAGQLEDEIRRNGWLSCEADQALVFNRDLDSIYDTALSRLGVDASMLSSDAGHA